MYDLFLHVMAIRVILSARSFEVRMQLLKGKKVLVVGMMSERSIAYGIAQSMHQAGADLIFSCLERFVPRVTEIASQWGPARVFPCDVSMDEDITRLGQRVAEQEQGLDGLVHSVAFAPRDHLQGRMIDHISKEGFLQSMDISVYSFIALARTFEAMMRDDSSVMALSYIGAERAVPNYNAMGVAKAALESSVRYLARDFGARRIRVNAISAGPVRTASAAGIKGMSAMLQHVAERSPISKSVTTEQIGNVATFLTSHMASAVTGEVIYVDNGYHIVAM